VGETTGSAWIGAFRDADVDCRVACRDAVWGSRGACRDAVVVDIGGVTIGFCDAGVGGIVDVATDPICRDEACHDADVGGTADVTAGPYCGVEACRDADVGGTADVTAGP